MFSEAGTGVALELLGGMLSCLKVSFKNTVNHGQDYSLTLNKL